MADRAALREPRLAVFRERHFPLGGGRHRRNEGTQPMRAGHHKRLVSLIAFMCRRRSRSSTSTALAHFRPRVVDQIAVLARIAAQTIEFVHARPAVAHELPLPGAPHALIHRLDVFLLVLRVEGGSPRDVSLFEKWQEVPATNGNSLWQRRVSHGQQSREPVQIQDDLLDAQPRLQALRPANDRWHPQGMVVHVGARTLVVDQQPAPVALVPETVMAQVVAVIAAEDDDRVVCHAGLVESVQDAPDTAVDASDRREVFAHHALGPRHVELGVVGLGQDRVDTAERLPVRIAQGQPGAVAVGRSVRRVGVRRPVMNVDQEGVPPVLLANEPNGLVGQYVGRVPADHPDLTARFDLGVFRYPRSATKAVKPVVAVAGGQIPVQNAEVPLADEQRFVAGGLQYLRPRRDRGVEAVIGFRA